MEAFYQWLLQPGGLASGDPAYYSSGQATPDEYRHLIRTAINNLQYASDPTASALLYQWIIGSGLAQGDWYYYASGQAQPGEIDNLVNTAAGVLQSSAAPTPAAPAPGQPAQSAPAPAPGPITPATPQTPTNTTPPAPTPIDWEGRVQALYPWLPSSLVQMFADQWAETGDQQLALAFVRASDPYKQAFPGIVRADGTLRMSELEWFSTREAYGRLFQEFGLNDTLFTDRFTELMDGDVSPAELAGRLGGAYEEIIGNIGEVRDVYSQWFGENGMSDAAIFASFIDPDIGDAILNRRVSVAQVGGEGLARGYDVTQDFASRLVAGGIDQGMARNFFVQAEGQLYNLDQLAKRHRDPDDSFDLEEFAQANVFGDATQTRRIRRLLRQEASLFTPREIGGVQTESNFALSGLSAR